MGPAGTPLEAMHRMISTKKLSSKINYSVLDNLFDQLRPRPARLCGPCRTLRCSRAWEMMGARLSGCSRSRLSPQ